MSTGKQSLKFRRIVFLHLQWRSALLLDIESGGSIILFNVDKYLPVDTM